MSSGAPGSLSPTSNSQFSRYEWKYIASEKTTSKSILYPLGILQSDSLFCMWLNWISLSSPPDNTYLCLAVLRGILCVISLNARSSPQSSPSSTPCMQKSLSVEAQPDELQEKMLKPMHYARSGLGTAELNCKLIAAGTQWGKWTRNPLDRHSWLFFKTISFILYQINIFSFKSVLYLSRWLQQRRMLEDCGVLRYKKGLLDFHRTHAHSTSSLPDGRANGRDGSVSNAKLDTSLCYQS